MIQVGSPAYSWWKKSFSFSREKPSSHHINILVCAYFFLSLLTFECIQKFKLNSGNGSLIILIEKTIGILLSLIYQLKKTRTMALRFTKVMLPAADELNDKKSSDYVCVFYLCKWTRQLFAKPFAHLVLCISQILLSIILIFFSLERFCCCLVWPRLRTFAARCDERLLVTLFRRKWFKNCSPFFPHFARRQYPLQSSDLQN